MKKYISIILASLLAVPSMGQRWSIGSDEHHIVWCPSVDIPHYDSVEMTGEATSLVLRWGVDSEGAFHEDRSLVFPLLRTVPNDTHASLVFHNASDIPSLLNVDGMVLRSEQVRQVKFDGIMEVKSDWLIGPYVWIPGDAGEPAIEMTRSIFPSRTLPLTCERYVLRNISRRTHAVYIPEFTQSHRTDAEKGVTGSYIIQSDITGSGLYRLGPGDSLVFDAVFQAYRDGGNALCPDVTAELAARRSFIRGDIGQNFVLETPDPVLDASFHFSKIRASESIIRTSGGYMHAPGGEVFYAALWANDQCEYVIPFFPFLGYDTANASAINTFRHYARFMNQEYRPLPSSIIAEGLDIWNGAGDRGDAAMCAYGASRYALARGDRAEAEELWRLIEWCLEYCRRNITEDGVVASDTDELEGRFPVGRTNLATSSLYYDALQSAAFLGREIGVKPSVTNLYLRQARELADAVERHFGRDIEGYHTYRYSEINDRLRAWICMPLVVDLPEPSGVRGHSVASGHHGVNSGFHGHHGRRDGTVAALLGPELCTEDGILTEEGDSVFWDRSTLYAMRGIFRAGHADEAASFLHGLAARRLTGEHVPYFIEAWPEGAGSMRQLSAESGLYCRIFSEGLFGIRPTGFRSFELTPSLPSDWDRAALRHIRAFGCDFDIELLRVSPGRLQVTVLRHGATSKIYTVKSGTSLHIVL